jgi:hypothetical protein
MNTDGHSYGGIGDLAALGLRAQEVMMPHAWFASGAVYLR